MNKEKILDSISYHQRELSYWKKELSQIKNTEISKKTEIMFSIYKENNKSIDDVARVFNCTRQNISLIFHKYYFDEYKLIQKQKRESKKETRQCPYCEETFTVPKTTVKVYCSQNCYSKYVAVHCRTPEEKRKMYRERMKKYYRTQKGKAAILRAHEKQMAKPDFAQKARAWANLHRAVKDGNIIKPDNCEECNAHKDDITRLEAHHDDHNKPLDVKWVCPPCHKLKVL